MANPFFSFKQFTIYQDRCAMKVGTDGVLLGSWVACEQAKRVLDIGTGTGLIAMMIAQRSEAWVDGVELDPDAASQAKGNADKCPFSDRIEISEISFQEYVDTTDNRYDLIVSNPPFFNNSLKPPKENRTAARHTDTLNFEEIIDGAKRLLTPDGRLAVILPMKEAESFIELAAEYELYCSLKTRVLSHEEARNPKRLLLEFSVAKTACVTNELIIETNVRHQYTEQYKALTKEFYLDKENKE